MTFDEFLERYKEALEKKPEEEREKFKALLFNTYKELYNDNSENKEEK